MRFPRGLFLVALPIAAAVGACADASGRVTGGGYRYDAQPIQYPDASEDCGTEITWTSLYRDYFGNQNPMSKGKCSGGMGDENNCHLKSDAAGALASNGYVCGMTQTDCYNTFKMVLVPPMNVGGTDYAHYFQAVLRQGGNLGVTPMPLRPASAVFTPCDMARIKKWADNGAKND